MPTCGSLHITDDAPDYDPSAVTITDCGVTADAVSPEGVVRFEARVKNENSVPVDVWVKWSGNGEEIEGVIEAVGANTSTTMDTGDKTYSQLADQFGQNVDVPITARVKDVFEGGSRT